MHFDLQQNFGLVKFHTPGNATIDVAPLDWIRKQGNRTICNWPSSAEASSQKRLVSLIRNKAVVDKETYDVKR